METNDVGIGLEPAPAARRKSLLLSAIDALASLRLTVALLGMSMFIVFAGTVAQIDKGIWTVVREFFRTPITWIDFRIFFPRHWDVPGGIYFPGGWLIGAALLVNLLAAHARRFKVKARGRRLALGLVLTAIGLAITWYIVAGAVERDFTSAPIHPYWRILIQLIEGTVAGLVLLAGCALMFRERAGIVLLHGGIILMMLSELYTGLYAREGQMTVPEGQSASWVEDTRHAEIAVIDGSDSSVDRVIAVPHSYLRPGRRIRHEALPFDLQVVQFMPNSEVFSAQRGATNLATAGEGLQWVAVERAPVSGVDTNRQVDMPSAYVAVHEKGTGKPLATYLLSTYFSLNNQIQTVSLGGKPYELYLRFERTYKPYTIHLHDFRFDRYLGTNQPKNYSSDVTLSDPERKVERKVRIWMNNPLRYRGDTLYQSSFTADEKATVLQVVTNSGWMVPYVSCMIVAVGLLAHFGLTLTRFLRRSATA